MLDPVKLRTEQDRDERNLHTLIIINTYGVPVQRLAKVVGVSRQTLYRRMAQAQAVLKRKHNDALARALRIVGLTDIEFEAVIDEAASHNHSIARAKQELGKVKE